MFRAMFVCFLREHFKLSITDNIANLFVTKGLFLGGGGVGAVNSFNPVEVYNVTCFAFPDKMSLISA